MYIVRMEIADISDLQAGKAGEYLVCADLILRGYIAYLSEQGLPYDVVMDFNGKLLKVQVKSTRSLRIVKQRSLPLLSYMFDIKSCGKRRTKRQDTGSVDLFALVAVDIKTIAYLSWVDIKSCMNFRPEHHKELMINEHGNKIQPGTAFLSDYTLEKAILKL